MQNNESLIEIQARLAAQDEQLANAKSRMDRSQAVAIDPSDLESVDALCRQSGTAARLTHVSGLRC